MITSRPTIVEVAAKAQVGTTTVSRVLNGHPHVGSETRQRVLAAVSSLGYIPNHAARTLRPGQRSDSWVMLVDDVSIPFFADLVNGIDRLSADDGIVFSIMTSQDSFERETAIVLEMAKRRIDGMFVLLGSGSYHDFLAQPMPVPTVFLDRDPDGAEVNLVTFDYYDGVKSAVKQLVTEGHNRIGYIGGNWNRDPGRRKREGYFDALRDAGIPVDLSLIRAMSNTARDGERMADEVLQASPPPSAMVMTNEEIARGALVALGRGDVVKHVVVCGNVRWPFHFPFDVTVIEQDGSSMASTSVQFLKQRLDFRDRPPELEMIPMRPRKMNARRS